MLNDGEKLLFAIIFVLHRQGLKHHEISNMLEIPKSTATYRIKKYQENNSFEIVVGIWATT